MSGTWNSEEAKRLKALRLDPVQNPPEKLTRLVNYFKSPGASIFGVTEGGSDFHVSKGLARKVRDLTGDGRLDWVLKRFQGEASDKPTLVIHIPGWSFGVRPEPGGTEAPIRFAYMFWVLQVRLSNPSTAEPFGIKDFRLLVTVNGVENVLPHIWETYGAYNSRVPVAPGRSLFPREVRLASAETRSGVLRFLWEDPLSGAPPHVQGSLELEIEDSEGKTMRFPVGEGAAETCERELRAWAEKTGVMQQPVQRDILIPKRNRKLASFG